MEWDEDDGWFHYLPREIVSRVSWPKLLAWFGRTSRPIKVHIGSRPT